MKKYLSLIVGLMLASSVFADSTSSFTLHTGTLTGIYTNGPIRVTGFTIIAPTATNCLIQAIDSGNGMATWTNAAYTNTISWASNNIVVWTNYYGIVDYTTNLNLIDVTNNLVAGSTNNWPVKFSAAVAAGGASTVSGVTYTFFNGLYVTNASAGDVTVVFQYSRLF